MLYDTKNGYRNRAFILPQTEEGPTVEKCKPSVVDGRVNGPLPSQKGMGSTSTDVMRSFITVEECVYESNSL